MRRTLASSWIAILTYGTLFSGSIMDVTAAPQVKIGNTVVTGLAEAGAGTEFFGGIPFAKPPLGALRFAPPVITYNLTGSTFDATASGPICKQPPFPFGPSPAQSEDCLTVEVYRPAGLNATSKLPVMVWIHGGGFTSGWPGQYNGSLLVARSVARRTPVVYVAISYRLGTFGFPNGVEATKKGILNLGIKDQIAALKWVQKNIGAFGGDKSKVTLFGESAGAMSIANLYFNSDITSLARAAILESGAPEAGLSPGDDATWKRIAQAVPTCANHPLNDTITCLRQATAQQIQDAQDSLGILFPLWPVVDGPGGIIPERTSKLVREGKFAKLPFIGGTNLDEGPLFIPDNITTNEILRDWLKSTWLIGVPANSTEQNKIVDKLFELYPDNPALGSPFGTGNETFGRPAVWKRASALYGDFEFQVQQREWRTAAVCKGIKVYGYHFTDPQPQNTLGVYHSSEMPYVFGPAGGFGAGPLPPTLPALSPIIQDYWISFATSLNPNDGKGSTRPAWPAYASQQGRLLELKGSGIVSIQDDFRKKQIEFISDNWKAFAR